MDIRPQSAPPRPPPPPKLQTSLPLTTEDLHRRSKTSIGSRSPPGALELAGLSLYSRVRALITLSDNGYEDNSEDDGDGGGADRSNENQRTRTHGLAGAASPYYVDGRDGIGDSGGTGALDGQRKSSAMSDESGDLLPRDDDNRYEPSEELDLEPVIRVGSVVQKTVASSIVREYSPALGRPHFSHASIPADIGQTQLPFGFPMRNKHRSLGKMTPSPAASGVSAVEALVESSEDEEEAGGGGEEHDTSDGGGTGKTQQTPSNTRDPVTRVLYDSGSSSHSPDLFARPLHVGSPVKRDADTPVNTIATPPPLIGITAATSPTVSQASPTSMGTSDHFGSDEYEHSTHADKPNQSIVGHTGASTPEEEIALGTATISGGNASSFDYDEYTEQRYGSKAVSTSHEGAPTRSPSVQHPEDAPLGYSGKYSTDTFAALSSYDDSDPHLVKRSPLTLHQAYVQSDLSKAESSVADLIRANIHHSSRSMMGSTENLGTPNSAPSFTRIISDLEEMLNQALEIAGRAVQGSHSALDQRDRSIRSAKGSTHESFLSVFEGTDPAVTAPESIYVQEEIDLPEGKMPEQRAGPEPEQMREHAQESMRDSVNDSMKGSMKDSTRESTRESMSEQIPVQVSGLPMEVSEDVSSELTEDQPKRSRTKVIQQDASIGSSVGVSSENWEHSSRRTSERNGKGRSRQKHHRSPIPFIDMQEFERERAWNSNRQNTSASEMASTRAIKGYSREESIDMQESERESAWNSNRQNTSASEMASTRAIKGYSREGSIARASVPGNLEQQFRMEVGENGEIILVRLPRPDMSLEFGPPRPAEAAVVCAPRRYKGGWEWNLWSKRFTASVACAVVGLNGWIIGSY
ncbi:hypothetical protein BZA05DRAFT_20139 [Tricharina praecox]|uniref:uncharacterized protein n=1 Tax=Tricharina praecox TaxID=43433 RepID=UPI00221FE3CB|nr:uncharacterized protein BZA05DRAFT_20139 [Tricharina praecox]KAI5859033.1 hypothetical protein BZA05DRAFT_20139 [Tricharina praecox]